MSSSKKANSAEHLISLCHDHSIFGTKFAKVSLLADFSWSFEVLVFLFEYLQLISPLLVFSLAYKKGHETFLAQLVTYLAQFAYPSSWVTLDPAETSGIMILSIVFIFMILRYLLVGYVIHLIRDKRTTNNRFISLWRVIFEMQGRLIYSVVSSCWVYCIIVIKKNRASDPTYSDLEWLIPVAVVLIASEYAFSLYLNLLFCYVLPTKSFLASKHQIVEIMALSQKMVIQILLILLPDESKQSTWIFTIINFTFDLFRRTVFLGTLQFYQLNTLLYQGVLSASISTLNLSAIVVNIVRSVDEDSSSLSLFLILWVVASGFYLVGVQIVVKKLFLRLIFDPSVSEPGLLIHKIDAIKEIRRRTKAPMDFNDYYDEYYLTNKGLCTKAKDVLKVNSEGEEFLDINCEESTNKMFHMYLKRLMDEHPKNKFIKLHMANFLFKTWKRYGEAIRILLPLQGDRFSGVSVTASVLLLEIQDDLRRDHEVVNLLEFVNAQRSLARLKRQMKKQAKLQISICSEILKESPDLAEISTSSQKFASDRGKIIRKCKQLQISDNFLDSVILSSFYHLILNHSINEHIRYYEIYQQKLRKHQKAFSQNQLCQENIYQDNTGFMIISGQKSDAGNLIFLSKSLEPVFGGNFQLLVGTNIAAKAAPCLRNNYAEYYKSLVNEDIQINSIREGFVYHQEGYLVHVNYSMNILPYVTQGLYFAKIIRPIVSNQDFIYILENGDIDSFTQNIGQKLDLFGINFCVGELSKELMLVNDVCNFVAFPEKYSGILKLLNAEEVNQIYTKYSTVGKDILLTSTGKKRRRNSYRYYCKVMNKIVGGTVIKLLKLEEMKEDFNQGEGKGDGFYETSINEKDNGWIDLEVLKTKRVSRLSSTQCGNETLGETSRPFMSSSIESPRRSRFFYASKEEKALESPNLKVQKSNSTDNMRVEEDSTRGEGRGEKPVVIRQETSINTSSVSKFSRQKRISRLFHAALDTYYSPKTLKIIILLFCVLFASLTAAQVAVKISLDRTLQNIQVKKDVLTEVQKRNNQMITLQINLRVLWDTLSDKIDDEFEDLEGFTLELVESVADSNQGVLQKIYSSSSFDQEIKDFIFQKNVKMYENYFDEEASNDYVVLDSFQATNRIVETGLSVLSLNKGSVTPASETQVNFLFRNCLNEVLIKNNEISKLLLESLSQQVKTAQMNIYIQLIVSSVFVLIIFLFFEVTIRKQYIRERMHYSTYCHLNPSKVETLVKNFRDFKDILESEQNIQPKSFYENGTLVKSISLSKEITTRNYSKIPKYQGITKKYLKHALRILFSGGIILILIALISRSNVNCFGSIKDIVSKISFSEQLELNIRLARASSQELIASNNTAEIKNKLAIIEVNQTLKELTQMRIDAYDLFTNDDDEIIQEILFGTLCKTYDPNVEILCNMIDSENSKSGLIYLLSNLEGLFRENLNAYLSSNKSSDALQEIAMNNLDLVVANYLLSITGGEKVSSQISNLFEEELESAKNSRKRDLAISLIGLAVMGCWIWFFCIRRLKYSIVQFKNALRVLPAEIVLSNFVLKSFLIKTSKGALDKIKIDL